MIVIQCTTKMGAAGRKGKELLVIFYEKSAFLVGHPGSLLLRAEHDVYFSYFSVEKKGEHGIGQDEGGYRPQDFRKGCFEKGPSIHGIPRLSSRSIRDKDWLYAFFYHGRFGRFKRDLFLPSAL